MKRFQPTSRFRLGLFSLLGALLLATPGRAQARPGSGMHSPQSVIIEGSRIELGQLDPTVPRHLLQLDVGPAPLPGKSSVVSRAAIARALSRAGADPDLARGLPAQQPIHREGLVLTKRDLRHEVESQLSRELPVGVRITQIGGLEDITLPKGNHDLELDVSRIRRTTRVTARVSAEGRVWASLPLTVMLEGEAQTPVLRRNIPRQGVIGAGDVAMKATALDHLPPNTALRKEALVGRVLIQPGRVGKPLAQSAVKVPPVVKRGTELTLVAESGQIRVSQAVRADEDGAIGDWIRVRPISGARPIEARVVAAGLVRLDLGSRPR